MRDNVQQYDRRRVLKAMSAAGISIGLAGCSGDGNGNGGNGNGGSDFSNITALGGITGGTGYQQCLVMQQIVHQEMSDVRVTVEGTSGWSTDAKLMYENGRDAAEFGIVPAGHAYDILYANGDYSEEKNYIVQAWPAVPPTYMHIAVPKNSDIESYSDLEGKRVNVLSRGSLTEGLTPTILESLGISNVEYLHYPHQEASNALTAGDIDAVAAGGTAAPYMELSQNTPLRVLSLNEDQKDPISQALPSVGFATADFGGLGYNGAGESLVPAPWTLMATLLDLSEDFVYEVTKAIFNNIELAKQIYEPASDLTPDKAPQTNIPVHPGAYKFYQEEGIEFSEELQPPAPDELPLSN